MSMVNMTKLKKLTKHFPLVSILAAVLLSALLAPAPASAEITAQEFVADVTLLGMEHIGHGRWMLYLGMPGGAEPEGGAPETEETEEEEEPQVDFVLTTQLACPFFNNRGKRVTPAKFFADNGKKIVSIEFLEYENSPGNYVVTECRSHGEKSGGR